MAELLVRIGGQDEALLRRALGSADRPGLRLGPNRVVVDAHVASTTPVIKVVTRRAGIPFLIDPQTFLLQDRQHAAHPWVKLPFAEAAASSARDLLRFERQEQLVASCVDYQIDRGATAVIAPYVHVENAQSPWLDVQFGLWRQTRRYLDQQGVRLPLVAVAAVGWRLLGLSAQPVMRMFLAALTRLSPDEVALAASKVHLGAHADERLVDMISVLEQLRHSGFLVLAWSQGLLGEACVAAGALGYETGLGWRESCDLSAAMTTHRRPCAADGFGTRPVYLPVMKRGIPKATLLELQHRHQQLWRRTQCPDPDCCAVGSDILGDAREHALYSRARDLRLLSQVARSSWQWNRLEQEATAGLALADRINRAMDVTGGAEKINTVALAAVRDVAGARRLHRRAQRIA